MIIELLNQVQTAVWTTSTQENSGLVVNHLYKKNTAVYKACWVGDSSVS